MQPYIFPYIGYMNLVKASNVFVFYDDVNFIKRGWINRNRIILFGKPYRFTIPLKGSSQNKLIKDLRPENINNFSKKFLNQLSFSYRDAPYLRQTLNYVEEVLLSENKSIGDLAASSVEKFFEYCDLNKLFFKSSIRFKSTHDLRGVERLLEITKHLEADQYVNAIGGMDLYSQSDFEGTGISLSFLKPNLYEYSQVNSKEYFPGLSIIDLMMNQSIIDLRNHLDRYDLVE